MRSQPSSSPELGKQPRSAARMRARRNEYEYPDEGTYLDPDIASVDLGKAREIVHACKKIIEHGLPVFKIW